MLEVFGRGAGVQGRQRTATMTEEGASVDEPFSKMLAILTFSTAPLSLSMALFTPSPTAATAAGWSRCSTVEAVESRGPSLGLVICSPQ